MFWFCGSRDWRSAVPGEINSSRTCFLAADTAERKGMKANIRQKQTKDRSDSKTDLQGVEPSEMCLISARY